MGIPKKKKIDITEILKTKKVLQKHMIQHLTKTDIYL